MMYICYKKCSGAEGKPFRKENVRKPLSTTTVASPKMILKVSVRRWGALKTPHMHAHLAVWHHQRLRGLSRISVWLSSLMDRSKTQVGVCPQANLRPLGSFCHLQMCMPSHTNTCHGMSLLFKVSLNPPPTPHTHTLFLHNSFSLSISLPVSYLSFLYRRNRDFRKSLIDDPARERRVE